MRLDWSQLALSVACSFAINMFLVLRFSLPALHRQLAKALEERDFWQSAHAEAVQEIEALKGRPGGVYR